MVPIAESPGDGSSRRGSTRGQNSGAKAVVAELPKGDSVMKRKRNLESSLAVVPLAPVGVPAIDKRVTPMDLVVSSDGVQAVLAAIVEQEALSISLPVAAHTTNPCTLPLQEEVVNETATNGNEQMCKQRPSQPTPSHIIAHHRTSSHCHAVQSAVQPISPVPPPVPPPTPHVTPQVRETAEGGR